MHWPLGREHLRMPHIPCHSMYFHCSEVPGQEATASGPEASTSAIGTAA